MRRDLPVRPSLEHLKKQAKDLLDAHRRADPEALARIRDAVPSFATKSDAEIARAPFALHDSQSAIAREHGAKSWNELRDAVAAKSAEQPPSEALLRALMPRLPEGLGTALQEAWTRRAEADAVRRGPRTDVLPLVALRDALLTPKALAPIHVGRAASRAAVEAALARTPPTLAVFSQRAVEAEDVSAEALHPIGVEAFVYARIPDGDTRAWVVLEGVRWIALESIEPDDAGYMVARVGPMNIVVAEGEKGAIAALVKVLREGVRERVKGLPEGQRLIAILDALTDPGELADLVIANVQATVAEKAKYAGERRLIERVRTAKEMVERQGPGSPG